MQTTFIILIACATVVTTITNFIKPIWKGSKNEKTFSILCSLVLGVVSAFSVEWYLWIELTTGALILIGLAIGTGAGIWYDLWSLIKGFENKTQDLPKIK